MEIIVITAILYHHKFDRGSLQLDSSHQVPMTEAQCCSTLITHAYSSTETLRVAHSRLSLKTQEEYGLFQKHVRVATPFCTLAAPLVQKFAVTGTRTSPLYCITHYRFP